MRPVPRLCKFYTGICLTTEEKARKNLSQGRRRVLGYILPKCTHYKIHTYTHTLQNPHMHTHITKSTHTHTHTLQNPHMHTHITKSTHTHTHTLQNPHIHTLQNPHMHTHTLQNPHIHTHYKTHTYTHIT